jgi:hypothetical protein
MTFLIADTFTESLARLTGDEQKAVKTTAFDLQMDPSGSGLSFHKLDKARDKRFWSVRVNAAIRLIVHRTDASLLLCYVDHHDRAYAWGERRKLETHPATGAAQIVEIRESVREIVVPKYVEQPATPKAPVRPLAGFTDEALLGYGVPAEWLTDVRAADEDGRRHARTCPGSARRCVHAPGRAAPLPRCHQRRGTGAGARRALGEMGSLPPPGAAPARHA